MHITFKSISTAILSFLFPGFGQIFYGKWLWGITWFALALFITPSVAFLAAIHCLFIE